MLHLINSPWLGSSRSQRSEGNRGMADTAAGPLGPVMATGASIRRSVMVRSTATICMPIVEGASTGTVTVLSVPTRRTLGMRTLAARIIDLATAEATAATNAAASAGITGRSTAQTVAMVAWPATTRISRNTGRIAWTLAMMAAAVTDVLINTTTTANATATTAATSTTMTVTATTAATMARHTGTTWTTTTARVGAMTSEATGLHGCLMASAMGVSVTAVNASGTSFATTAMQSVAMIAAAVLPTAGLATGATVAGEMFGLAITAASVTRTKPAVRTAPEVTKVALTATAMAGVTPASAAIAPIVQDAAAAAKASVPVVASATTTAMEGVAGSAAGAAGLLSASTAASMQAPVSTAPATVQTCRVPAGTRAARAGTTVSMAPPGKTPTAALTAAIGMGGGVPALIFMVRALGALGPAAIESVTAVAAAALAAGRLLVLALVAKVGVQRKIESLLRWAAICCPVWH
mmetsp:Transcript_85222/g.275947  ORF Transcript_85222/g.275947 Transcript_85222/m.275947 type:complete len:466 (+) Transcript_85222:139-1536(+)